MESKISIRHINKSYRKNNTVNVVLDDISLDIQKNEFMVLLGPGLCGKTVLIDILSGIERPDSGEVLIDGIPADYKDHKTSVIFQRIGLFPWKTVLENVEFGPKMRSVGKRERRQKAMHYIEMVGLKGFENAYPHQLSGGMKQRAGIARAYTNDTEILLMDEPFGALDAQTRYSMEEEILKLWQQDKRTVVFVTNNIDEAIFLSDRIVLLSKAPGSIKEIYIPSIKRPRDHFDIEFMKLRELISENTDLAIQ